MTKIKPFSDQQGVHQGYTFYCPGCETHHSVYTTGKVIWTFNGNHDKPTFTPSIKVTGVQPTTDEEVARIMAGEKVTPKPYCCHSHITDGNIQFGTDCTHKLAGQTVPLGDYLQ